MTGTMVGFGYKQAWLAIADGDVTAVATAFGLRDLGEVSWAQGADLAYLTDDRVLVTPPLSGWTLAFGRYLWRHDGADVDVAALSETLGTEVQYFLSYRVPELHVWRRATKGILLRSFGYLGERGEVTDWAGDPTPVERDLGLPAELAPDGPFIMVGEQDVMRVAAAWSVDPTSLDGRPATGPLRAFAA